MDNTTRHATAELYFSFFREKINYGEIMIEEEQEDERMEKMLESIIPHPSPTTAAVRVPIGAQRPKGGTSEMKSSEIKVSSRAFAMTRCRTRTTTRVYTSAEKKRKREKPLSQSFIPSVECMYFILSISRGLQHWIEIPHSLVVILGMFEVDRNVSEL